MTAPAPALTAVLDQLDELRAKATPGPWHVAMNGSIDAGEYDTVIAGGPVDCMSHCYGGTSTLDGDNLPADAALIVAAVNRLPELTAALRALQRAIESPAEEAVKRVEALAERWKSEGGWTESYVADLRAALASPAPAPQGEDRTPLVVDPPRPRNYKPYA